MANRLLDSFSGWKGGNGGSAPTGAQPIKPTSTRLASEFDDWKKKRKPEIDKVMEAEAARRAQEQQTPPVSKPVDQIEHEEKKSFLGHLDAISTQTFYKGLENIGQGIAGVGRSIQENPEKFGDQPNILRIKEDNLLGKGAMAVKKFVGQGVEDFGKGMEGMMKTEGERLTDKEAIIPELQQPLVDENGKFNWDLAKNPKYAASQLVSGIYSMIPGFAATVATGGGAPAMMGTMALMEKGNAYEDYTSTIAKNKGIEVKDLTPEDISEADKLSSIYGALSGVLETLPLEGFLSKIGGKRAAQGFLRTALLEVPKDVLIQVTQEGSTEGLQQFAQNLIAKQSGVDPNRNVMEGVAESAYGGAITGGVMGVVPAITAERAPLPNQDVEMITQAQQGSGEQTPPEEAPQEAPAVSEGAISLLESLDTNDTAKAEKIRESLSSADLQNALKILTTAEQQGSPDQKAAIQQDIQFVQTAINERESAVSDTVGKAVFEDKNEIDNQSESIRKESVKALEDLSKAEHEVSPKAEKLVTQIKENNKRIDTELGKIKEQKVELLRKKKLATTPEAKQDIQEEIDFLDDVKVAYKEYQNKSNIDGAQQKVGEISAAKIKELEKVGEGLTDNQKESVITNKKKLYEQFAKNTGRGDNEGGLPGSLPVGGEKQAGAGKNDQENAGKGQKPGSDTSGQSRKRLAERQLVKELPEETQQAAEEDWTENYAEKYGENENRIMEIKRLLKDAKKTEAPKLEKELNELLDEQGKAEDAFVEKWQKEAPEEESAPILPEEEKATAKQASKTEIEKLVNSKDTFTEEEKALLRQYEGSGGQKEGEGRGVLDEYYTPKIIVDKVWELVKQSIIGDIKQVIEPSAGTGRFIESAPKNIKIVGLETNPISAKIAQALNPDAKIINQPFEATFIDEKGNKTNYATGYADVVIGNPPYGIHRGKYKGLGEETKIGRYEEYFLKRALDLTREGGVVAMVVPSGFLRGKLDYARKTIAKLGRLDAAYRLPNGAFGTTDVGTDIVIIRKDGSKNDLYTREQILSNDYYFTLHPENILGEETERKGRFGIEKYVEGDLQEAIQKLVVDEEVAEQQAVEEFNDEDKELVEMEQPLTPEVKKEAIRKTRVAKVKKTKASVAKKDVEVKGVLKRDSKNPHIVIGTKKANIEIYSQGEKLEPQDQRLYDLQQEDGSIRAIDINEFEKSKLNFHSGKYYTDFNYYQGDIYEKLEQLERDRDELSAEQYERQKKHLEAIKPDAMTIKQITVLPIDKMAKEIKLLNGKSLIDNFSEWLQSLPHDALEGSSRWEIAGYLNGQPVRGGNVEQNAKERTRRRRVANKLFKKFYNEELEEADQTSIADKFNRTFNSYAKPDYTKYPLQIQLFDTFYKKNFNIRPIQMEGAAFLVNKGTGLLAYEVGVGKTLAGIAAISEVMRKGWAKKPLIIVPKNLKSKWIRDLAESMPGVKINDLANLGGNFKYKGKPQDLKIADGSISIITEDGFKRIGFAAETYDRLTSNLEDVLYDAGGKKSKRGKEIEKAKTEEVVGMAMKKTDYPLTFEQFGFDHITIDEAHRSKNIFSKAKAKGERGQSSNEYGAIHGAMSERGLKTYLATQYVLGQNGGRNVFLLTATPFNNSPIEIYSMLSLMAKSRLEQLGIKNINDFISLFCEIESKYAIKANGSVSMTDQVRKFSNLQQLQKLVREYIDFRTGGEAGIPRPEKTKLTPYLKMNEMQAEYVEKAQELFSPKFKEEGGTLLAISELQKITFSPYLSRYSEKPLSSASPKEIVENSPKIKYTVEAIKKAHEANPSVGQIIFSEKGIELFRPIRDYFIKELKYKPEEVEIIDSSSSDAVKDDIQDRFQNGEVKILLASGTVKEGIDLQKNSTDLYNLYLQWNPTDMIQAEGRTWRQGSFYDKVRIHYPLVQNSVDPFIFQKLEEKASRIANVFSYKGDNLDVSDIDFEGMKFELITDPVMRVEAKYQYDKAEVENKVAIAEADIAFLERRTKKIDELTQDIENYSKYKQEAKDRDDASDVAYYAEKVSKRKEELKEEQDKLAKKDINLEEVKAKIAEKEVELGNIKKQLEELATKFQEELEVAKEEKFKVISGTNNFSDMVLHMAEKAFFTHEGQVSVGVLPEKMKSISDSAIDSRLSEEEIMAEVAKLKKDMNPFLAKRLIVNASKDLIDVVDGRSLASAGLFNKYTGTISIAQDQERATMEEAVAHEPGHLAWMYLTDQEKSQALEEWKKISIEEKRELFGKNKQGHWRYDLYVVDYNGDYSSLSEEYFVTKAAKEYIQNKGKYSENKLIAYIQRFIEQFINLMNRVSEKLFGKKEVSAMDIMRQVYDSRSKFFEGRDYRTPEMRRAESYMRNFGAKPEMSIISVSLSDINIDPEVFDAMRDVEQGVKSYSYLPILLKSNPQGGYDILDGRHRLVEGLQEGKNDFLATLDEKTYRMYAAEEEAVREQKTLVSSHIRAGVPVRSYTRMKSILEEKEKPLVKEGRISVINLYRKVYSEFYEGKAPAMNSLEDEKLTRGMTKQAFTLGKRFATKVTKENYREVQKEIRNYIVKNIPPKNRGELLRAVINAKNKADVDIVIAKVDRMVEIAKGREIAAEKKQLMKEVYQVFLKRGMIDQATKNTDNPRVNGAMLRQVIQHVSKDDRVKMRQLTMDELKQLRTIALTLKQDQNNRIILVSDIKREKINDILPESLQDKEFVTMGDVEQSMANVDITGNWLGLLNKNLTRASRLVMIKNEITKKMYDKFTTAERRFVDEFEAFNEKMGNLYKDASGKLTKFRKPEMDEKVIGYLENRVAKGELTEKELALADEMIQFYADSIEVMKPKRLRKYYFTHTKQNFLEAVKSVGFGQAVGEFFNEAFMTDLYKDLPPEIAANLEFIVANRVFNPFGLPRKGARFSQDLRKALQTYARVYFMKKNFDRLYQQSNAVMNILPPNLQSFFRRYLQSAKGRPEGKAFNPTIKKVLEKATTWEYIKLLGGNIASGIFNIAVGTVDNYAAYGILTKDSLVKGHLRYATPQGFKLIQKYRVANQNVTYEMTQLMHTIPELTNKILFFQLGVGEHYLRGTAFLSSLTQEEYKTGVITDKRMSEIRHKIGEAQPLYGSFDSPVYGRHALGKTMYMFLTWLPTRVENWVNWVGGAASALKNEKGIQGKVINNKDLGKTVRWVSAFILMSLMFGDRDRWKQQMEDYKNLFSLDYWVNLMNPANKPVWKDVINLGLMLKFLASQEEYEKAGTDYERGDYKWQIYLKRLVEPTTVKRIRQGKNPITEGWMPSEEEKPANRYQMYNNYVK